MDSSNLVAKIIESNVANIFVTFPEGIRQKIHWSNIVNTYILVIEGKDVYDEITTILAEEGFDHFDTKNENNLYTLVFQGNGVNIAENLNKIGHKTDGLPGDVRVCEDVAALKEELKKSKDELSKKERDHAAMMAEMHKSTDASVQEQAKSTESADVVTLKEELKKAQEELALEKSKKEKEIAAMMSEMQKSKDESACGTSTSTESADVVALKEELKKTKEDLAKEKAKTAKKEEELAAMMLQMQKVKEELARGSSTSKESADAVALKEELKKAKEELAYEKSNGKEELVYLKEELKKSKDELVREKTRREEEVFVLTGEIQKSSRELEKGSCKGVCMVPEEIKKNYIERDLLSNKIREYISQDSRVPMLLSMAGLSSSILQGDIVGKLLNI